MDLTTAPSRRPYLVRILAFFRLGRVGDDDDRIHTRAEMTKVLDERARRFLGMSGADFVAALEAGTLPQTPTVVQLSILAGRTPRPS